MEKIDPSLCIFLAFLVQCWMLSLVTAVVTNITADQDALLALKAHITHDPTSLLTNNWSTSTSVCNWIGVACDIRHHRVSALNISDMNLTATIPPYLGNLSFLAKLAIKNNSFHGSLPYELSQLHRLKHLDLSFNNFNIEIPFWFGSLTKLQYLGLSENTFSGTIPESLSNLSSLQVLRLEDNKLSGEVPQELGNLAKMEFLSLAHNSLTGDIPITIANLTRLKHIDLSYNQLQGEIPQELDNLILLELFSLSNNFLTGAIPKQIGNLTLLEQIDLCYNHLQGQIPNEIGNLHNLKHLRIVSNNLVGPVPATVFNISTMKTLALAENQLSGILPSNVKLPNLEELCLSYNDFSGAFPIFITNASKLSILAMSLNSFSGFIPTTIGNLRNLKLLFVDDNYLTSTPELSFISSLANCKNLRKLSLGSNPLNGILPSSIGNLSISLENFCLYNSNISGSIPKEIGNLVNLIALSLGGNQLTGSIPNTSDRLRKLQGLHLPNNKLEGSIPSNLCHLNRLVELQLDVNKFSGSIPPCLGNLSTLRKLSLASNRLTSTIPLTLWNLSDILYLNLSSNYLNSSLPSSIGNLRVVVDINLSRNHLSGNIPPSIGGLKDLQSLSLGYNRLQGPIPQSFGDLINLELLDLASNNLSGVISKSLETLRYLKHLNLSFNQLSGEIPKGGSFVNFSAESFMGNLALCGSPKLQVPPCKTNIHGKSRTKKFLLLVVLPLSIVFTLLVLLLIVVLFKRLKKYTKLSSSIDKSLQGSWRRISYLELVRATHGFSKNNLLGQGSFGSVYKAKLEDGMELAIKVFHQHFEGAFTSFEVECDLLSSICHRNLVKIISRCSADDFKALILEYMSHGNLEQCLYSNYSFDFLQRLNIMIDIASALEYLHFDCSTPIIHCDLKLSNVLLDENMVAHLTDFGIAKLLGKEVSTIQTNTLATIGYMAPEYGTEGIVSRKGDVYSYGIMLMEIFTRKKPTDEIFTEETSLRSYVRQSLFCSTVIDVVDASLVRRDDEHFAIKEQCASSILSLAMECTKESPKERINIKEALTRLLKIRVKFVNIDSKKVEGYKI